MCGDGAVARGVTRMGNSETVPFRVMTCVCVYVCVGGGGRGSPGEGQGWLALFLIKNNAYLHKSFGGLILPPFHSKRDTGGITTRRANSVDSCVR